MDIINKIIDHLGDPVMLSIIVALIVSVGGIVAIVMALRKSKCSENKEPKPKKEKKPKKVKTPKPKKEKKTKRPKREKVSKQQPQAQTELSSELNVDSDDLSIDTDLGMDLGFDTKIDDDVPAKKETGAAMDLSLDTDLGMDLSIDTHLGEEEDQQEPEVDFDFDMGDETIEPEEIQPEEVAQPEEKPVVIEKPKKPKKVKKVKPPKPKKEKKPKKGKLKSSKLPANISEPQIIDQNDYEQLIKRIERTGKKLRSVLFAGAGIDSLPVTIPVNIAIELSKSGKKCLLVDLDLKRDAIATAFEIEEDKRPSDFTPKPFDTSFENLKVWPAYNFTKRRYVSVRSLVDAAVEKYDFVLLNAPYLDGNVDRSQIGLAADCAFLFTQTEKQAVRMYHLLESCNCKVMSNIQVSS